MEQMKLIVDDLLKKGIITKEQFDNAQEVSQSKGLPVDKVLINNNVITEENIASCLSEHLGIPFMDLSDYLIDASIVDLVPESLAQRYKLIPLFKIDKTLTVAMVNPQDINAIDQVRLKSECDIDPVLATETAVKNAINQYYGVSGTMEEVIGEISKIKKDASGRPVSDKELAKLAEDAPVVKLVNLIIMQAVKDKASDIHIEPDEKILRVRYRVDGVLQEGPTPPKELEAAILSRIKVLSGMDIAERRRPQDGRIVMKIHSRSIDLRVSSFPTVHGENIVIRILDKESILLGLEDIGMNRESLRNFDKLIRKSHGIILVTGPTGSGKTTTLYAALSSINSTEKNIITIEDPVEYQISMIRQTQVNPKAGLTFASGLRSILRQDPDIIMVGEIRDGETAEIATQAALTGHLVFSTLHTNDAASSLMRLIDMNVEPFLVSDSIIGILAAIALPKFVNLTSEANEAAAKGGLGAVRSAVAIRYAQDATATGFDGTFPTLAASDFMGGVIPANQLTGDSAINHTSAVVAGDSPTHATAGWWYVTGTVADAGRVGAYSDGTATTSDW